MLPTLERHYLFADLEDAVTLGSEGWLSEGFTVLDVGLAAAEAAAPGAGTLKLVERYRRAIVCYTATYGTPTAPEPELVHLRMLAARSR